MATDEASVIRKERKLLVRFPATLLFSPVPKMSLFEIKLVPIRLKFRVCNHGAVRYISCTEKFGQFIP